MPMSRRFDPLSRKVFSRRATVQQMTAMLGDIIEHETITIHPETPLKDPLDQCVKDYTFISSYLRLISNYRTETGVGVPLPGLISDGKQLVFVKDGSFAQVRLNDGQLPVNGIFKKINMVDVLKYGSSQAIADVIDTELDRLNNIVQDEDIKRNPAKYYPYGMVPVQDKIKT